MYVYYMVFFSGGASKVQSVQALGGLSLGSSLDPVAGGSYRSIETRPLIGGWLFGNFETGSGSKSSDHTRE